ncbi:hypothetical protein PV677_36435 [Streptomyces sp. DE06-01C]|uniref:hypothetical protein n=1 Tax=Streptomyces sp. DE06-01C TaxID=3028656 RepID=UPI0029C2006D|nr:hypothetical protein [Streptomyces sp. DE06-01C]MDX5526160.1 hypothetical protein [Streptomyces sp. DE06-01C]
MTTQPERLHHLLDRLLRGVLLPEEAEQLAGAVRILQARVDDQDEAASVAVSAVRLMNEAGAQRDRAEARARELKADNARLTAGQCLDSRAMCEKHHAPPVDGCPYPRCRAARNRDQRAATA